MDKLKLCPLLINRQRTPSFTVENMFTEDTYFSPCLRDNCAAFVDGSCRNWEADNGEE
jgi:hypothetical protein